MVVHGHEAVVRSLLTYLPPVSLFLGPHSVGRWTVAEHIRWRFGIEPDDVLRVHDLDVESARTIQQFVLTAPASSTFKLVIVDLYKSSQNAQVALSSVLRNTHQTKIIIVGQNNEVQLAVRQHAVVYPFRYLHPDEVAKILSERSGFSEERAADLALRSGGQVSEAIKLANADEELAVVRAALLALRSHDPDALNALSKVWTDSCTSWLAQWCNENLSGRWRAFDPEDRADGKSLAVRILIATKPRVRPRLVIRSQLMGLLRQG